MTVAVPFFFAFRRPVALTVTTDFFELFHVIFPEMSPDSTNCSAVPFIIVSFVLFNPACGVASAVNEMPISNKNTKNRLQTHFLFPSFSILVHSFHTAAICVCPNFCSIHSDLRIASVLDYT